MILDRKISVLATASILSFFAVIQFNSLENVNDSLLRDSKSNIFQEIKILKEKNQDLKKGVDDLNNTIAQLNDQNKALGVVQEEISEYTKLSGKAAVFGPGISVQISGEITTPWIVDVVNEFFGAGAQAVSVNGIRIANQTAGFDTLPKGQILLNGSILSSPYTLEAIGESATMASSLQTPGGLFDRLKKAFPNVKISLNTKEVVKMD